MQQMFLSLYHVWSPLLSEFQINVYAQNNESRHLQTYFGRIMKKNHKGRTLAAFAKYIMSFLKIKVEKWIY